MRTDRASTTRVLSALTIAPALALACGCASEGGVTTAPRAADEVNTGLARLGDDQPTPSAGEGFGKLSDDEIERMILESASLLGEVYGETPNQTADAPEHAPNNASAAEARISVADPQPNAPSNPVVSEITEITPIQPTPSAGGPSSLASLSPGSQGEGALEAARVGEHGEGSEGDGDVSFIEYVGHTPEPEPAPDEFITLIGGKPEVDEPETPSGRTYEALAAELSRTLRDMVRDADDPGEAFRAASALAGLEAIHPGSIDRLEHEGVLSPEELEIVKAAAELTRAMGARGEMTDPAQAAELMRELGDRLASSRGVRIATATLCTRVQGYGRYEEFPSNTFLAGRRQPVIIYVEMERFTHKPIVAEDGSERFEIKLSQRLELYHLADGLNTWNRAAEVDRSVSRKRVKDYYLINQVVLPETLSVGKYALKVVMRDLNDERGGMDEVTIPIEIVSDPSLAYPNTSRASIRP